MVWFTSNVKGSPKGGAGPTGTLVRPVGWALVDLVALNPSSSFCWAGGGFLGVWGIKSLGLFWCFVYIQTWWVKESRTGCGGFVIWYLRISIASSWGSGFFVNTFPSPFLKRQWMYINVNKNPVLVMCIYYFCSRPRRRCCTRWLMLFDDVFDVMAGIHALRVTHTGAHHILRRRTACGTCK